MQRAGGPSGPVQLQPKQYLVGVSVPSIARFVKSSRRLAGCAEISAVLLVTSSSNGIEWPRAAKRKAVILMLSFMAILEGRSLWGYISENFVQVTSETYFLPGKESVLLGWEYGLSKASRIVLGLDEELIIRNAAGRHVIYTNFPCTKTARVS